MVDWHPDSAAAATQRPDQQLREHPSRQQGQRREPGHVEKEQRQIEAAGHERQQPGSQQITQEQRSQAAMPHLPPGQCPGGQPASSQQHPQHLETGGPGP